MSDDFGARLIQRLEEAADRNQQVLRKNEIARDKLEKALPVLTKTLKGNHVILEAMKEIYTTLQADGEELSATLIELEQAKDSLQIATKLLTQANYDFSNIQTFSDDEVWLGNHLPTIRRALEVFSVIPQDDNNISLFEQALDDLEKERFEDIAHTVKRSGHKREAENA